MIANLSASISVNCARSSFDPLLISSSGKCIKLISTDRGFIRNFDHKFNLLSRANFYGGLSIQNPAQRCSVIAQSTINSNRNHNLQDEQRSDNGTQINQHLPLVLYSIIDVIVFIWRLPQLIIEFIQKEKEVIDKVEEDIDEVANIVKITAKVVEEIAEEVEKVAKIVEKDAKKVDTIMDEVKEKTKVIHDELEDFGTKSSEAGDKEVNLVDQEKPSKFSMINPSRFHRFNAWDCSRRVFLISTSIYSIFSGGMSNLCIDGWNVIPKTFIMALFMSTFLFLSGVQLTPLNLTPL